MKNCVYAVNAAMYLIIQIEDGKLHVKMAGGSVAS